MQKSGIVLHVIGFPFTADFGLFNFAELYNTLEERNTENASYVSFKVHKGIATISFHQLWKCCA